ILLLTALPVLLILAGNRPSLGTALALSTSLLGLSLLVIYPLVTGATTKAVSERYLGREVTVGSALSEAWSSVGTLLLTQLVVGLMVTVGFMLLFVPGLLWMLSYALVPSVVMIEASDRSIVRSLHSITGNTKTAPVIMDRGDIRRRSWNLVKGN